MVQPGQAVPPADVMASVDRLTQLALQRRRLMEQLQEIDDEAATLVQAQVAEAEKATTMWAHVLTDVKPKPSPDGRR